MRKTTKLIAGLGALMLASAIDPLPATAQSLGQWGLWGERPDRLKKYRPRPAPDRFERMPDRRWQNRLPPWWDEEPLPPTRSGPPPPSVASGGARPFIEPKEPEIVAYDGVEEPGTIIIDTSQRRLYFTLGQGEAYAYPISVGRDGFTWSGTEKISRIAEWPDWYPPKEMRQRDPKLPEKMTGGIKNPLGAVAMYLGNSLYRIHGTNDRKSIGQAASSGCFRMLNEHAVHLASIAGVGTVVKVLPHLPPPARIVREPLEPLEEEDVDVGLWVDEPVLPQLNDPRIERLDIVYRGDR